MNESKHNIRIELEKNDNSFEPGDSIRGTVHWEELDPSCESIEIRLIWFTRGKGDRDFETINTLVQENPRPNDQFRFEFEAPEYPPTFSGKLISLIWNIEVILFPATDAEHKEITISPTGQTLTVDSSVEPEKPGQSLFEGLS